MREDHLLRGAGFVFCRSIIPPSDTVMRLARFESSSLLQSMQDPYVNRDMCHYDRSEPQRPSNKVETAPALWRGSRGRMRGHDATGKCSRIYPSCSFPSCSLSLSLQSYQLSIVSSINYFSTSITHSPGNERVPWLLLSLASSPRMSTHKSSL
jgi:hypothetical protein